MKTNTMNYDIRLYTDTTTTATIWMAEHPALPGCKAQGVTMQAALDSLYEVREDYLVAVKEVSGWLPEPHDNHMLIEIEVNS